ncbi:helix-turn-helix domain-containing protein [Gallaecimonas sp. GXIMD1310]|uniref:helix-turn-helix domain-containing protein n=1 Tax=Gallaecimonas sp. GXIMD1310 TaxID=3131926 RepID=UPI003254F871
MLITPLTLLPVNLLELVFLALAVFSMLVLWPHRRLRPVVALLGLQAALLLCNLLEENGVRFLGYLLTPLFSWVFGPAFFLTIKGLVYGPDKLPRVDALHLLPVLLALPFSGQVQWLLALGSVSQIVYLAASARLLRHYHRAVQANRADADRLALNWLLWTFVVLVALVLLDLARINAQPYFSYALNNQLYLLTKSASLLLTLWLVLRLLRQPEIFSELAAFDAQQTEPEVRADNAEAAPVFRQIADLIGQQQLYRQPRLALNDVAELTGLSSKDVSWAINQGAGISFCALVNRLRVQAVCEAMAAAPEASILNLAMDAGFNAKSTFNAAFKAETGLTPSQYQKNVQKDDSGRQH